MHIPLRVALVVCAWWILIAPLWGQAPADKPAVLTVEQWIAQLGDLDYHKRDEATRTLEKMGVKALPALQAARKHRDAEIRRRVADLIATIEVKTILAPRLVTLKVTNQSAQQIVEELSKVTGYKIMCWSNNPQERYDFTWDKVPFWQVVEELCRTAGLMVQPSYGNPQMQLQGQGSITPHVWHEGAFRVTADSFNQNRTINFSTISRRIS